MVSVRAKLILALLLATVPTVCVLAYFGLESTTNLMRRQAMDRMELFAMTQARRMEDAIGHAIGDARYLARSPTVRAFAQASATPEGAPDELETRLLDEFVALAGATHIYSQVRYLDRSGQERVRVEYRDGGAEAMPEPALQNKSDRYYFQQAIGSGTDEVYVSPLDLNREDGRIEEPFRPVMRFVGPVLEGEDLLGVVVLNLEAGPLLPRPLPGTGSAFLADQNGWYLSHTDTDKAWSGPDNLNTGHSLQQDVPGEADDLLRPESATIQPPGRLLSTWPIMIGGSADRSRLVLGVEMAEADAFAEQRDFRRFFWTLVAISSVIPVLAGLALAAYFLRPLEKVRRAVHDVAGGNLDTTADVASCDEFQELAEDFNAMAARLREYREEERLALVGRMASTLIHDIKSPLGTITASARLLSTRGMSDEERESTADMTVAQVQRIAGMLQEILDFSRGEGKDPETQLVNVDEFIADLRPELKAHCTEHGIELVVETNGGCDVRADPDKLRRAVVNIATNAVEAMGDEGRLTLRAKCDGPGVAIAIADTGPGIPPEVADTLFEPFVTRGKPNGTGLGLAISSSIVGAHGGTLEASNVPDGGAAFTIWLPAAPEPDA